MAAESHGWWALIGNILDAAAVSVAKNPIAAGLLKRLGAAKLSNLWLSRFGGTRRLPKSSVEYTVNDYSALILGNVIFAENGEYHDDRLVREAAGVNFVADLGCNCGLFTLYVEHLRRLAGGPRSTLSGIMVEPNPKMVDACRRNLDKNSLAGMKVAPGLVGRRAAPRTHFWVGHNSMAGTAHPERLHLSGGGLSSEIVEFVDVETVWRNAFGDARVDVCKIDVEGFEIDFLNDHAEFLSRVDRIVLEWHKPQVTLQNVVDVLTPNGFRLENVHHEGEQYGVGWFTR